MQAVNKKQQTPIPDMWLVKGREEYDEQLNHLSILAWQISYTALWNTEEFSQAEKESVLQGVKTFLQQHTSPVKAYLELVQRVLLTRIYKITHTGYTLPFPSSWFDSANKHGFAGTERWYNDLMVARCSLPSYKIQLKAFAEAILEVQQTKHPADFHYWRNYFIQQNCQILLNLFLSTMANIMLGR